MTTGSSYQGELRDYLAAFHSESGLPKKALTLVLPQQNLVVQYEPKEGIPDVSKLRQSGKELAIASGTGAVVAGGAAMLIGRTLLGGTLARVGVAGAFGAIGLDPLLPAILIGGAIGGVGYSVYQFGKNRAENKQAQEFGEELLGYLKKFRPANPPPTDMVIVMSPNRRITIIYDPDLKS